MEFVKQKDYLVCVDSDGCAIDTMDIKHHKCFGPCMVAEWKLEQWAEPILTRWNEINLYTMTRGINRFKGLAMALTEINRQYTPIDGIDALNEWAEHAPELSNAALEAKITETGNTVFQKALAWSKAVNASINALPMDVKMPFAGVDRGLAAAHQVADVAVVSSANKEAVQEEWAHYGLLNSVDVLLCQDAGSKAHCIAELKKKGYAADHILMVGDAPGDKAAAEKNGVFYYPILVRHEKESWGEFPEALARLTAGNYSDYGAQKAQEFLDNLTR
jgi:phosphoglycolate phosphatase-like HAD superfamily hydrolase